MGRVLPGGWRLVVGAAVILVLGCGGGGGGQGGGQEAEKPKEPKGSGFEISWLGYLSRTYDGELSECAEATRAALAKLGLEVVDDRGGMFQKALEAESGDGTSLVVLLKEVTKATTRVSIKVGYLLGDKDAARRIHSEIEAELGARRAEAEERKRRWRPGPGTLPPAGGGAPPTTPPR